MRTGPLACISLSSVDVVDKAQDSQSEIRSLLLLFLRCKWKLKELPPQYQADLQPIELSWLELLYKVCNHTFDKKHIKWLSMLKLLSRILLSRKRTKPFQVFFLSKLVVLASDQDTNTVEASGRQILCRNVGKKYLYNYSVLLKK